MKFRLLIFAIMLVVALVSMAQTATPASPSTPAPAAKTCACCNHDQAQGDAKAGCAGCCKDGKCPMMKGDKAGMKCPMMSGDKAGMKCPMMAKGGKMADGKMCCSSNKCPMHAKGGKGCCCGNVSDQKSAGI